MGHFEVSRLVCHKFLCLKISFKSPLHDVLQAVLILGSTDFLGNPIGFLNDLSEGVSGLVSDGNVGGLLKNVAHGAANSAAKVKI